MSQRSGGSDSDKLNPTHVTSSRALGHFDQRRNDMMCGGDDDDKLLDVVGPPQSPLLPLGHSLSQFNSNSHGELIFILHFFVSKFFSKILRMNWKMFHFDWIFNETILICFFFFSSHFSYVCANSRMV